MLDSVEWGEFELGDLFEIESTLSFNTDKLVVGNTYDYVTRTSQNQGVLQQTGFVNETNINEAGSWSLGLLQMDFFYRRNPWYAGQFVRKITPKIHITEKAVSFVTALLNKHKKTLLSVLVRNVDETFKKLVVEFPIKNGEINFDFMEKYIAELEKERMEKLKTYLTENGLDNYILTSDEQRVLSEYDSIVWGGFKLAVLFNKVRTNKLPYKASELTNQPIGNYILPCLTSSFNNQGLNYYAPIDNATILKNVISIPSNSDVYRAYYQSNDFTVLSDAYAINWIYDSIDFISTQYLFAVTCINKVTDLPIYSYKNKLGGWNVVKNKYIQLPTINDKPDYKTMETLISAIQKLIIKDLVLYVGEKLK